PATTVTYTLSLHDALPISSAGHRNAGGVRAEPRRGSPCAAVLGWDRPPRRRPRRRPAPPRAPERRHGRRALLEIRRRDLLPLSATMRAVQVAQPNGRFELVEREDPDPGTGFVRVKIEACGICHS